MVPLTTVAVLTPPGAGGIAVVRVTGPAAASCVAHCLRARRDAAHDLRLPGHHRLRLGWFVDDVEVIDEVLVREAPAFQGLPAGIEICCHGGLAAARRVVEGLQRVGAVPVSHRDRLLLPRLLVEAREALLSANSPEAAQVFMREADGGMAGRGPRLHARLQRERESAAAEVRSELLDWLRRAPSGLALHRPPRIVITGPANAGKSTLLNALAGRHRALTSPLPGTTRDPINTRVAIGDYLFEVWDTAGRAEGRGVLDQMAAARGGELARGAALVLDVRDGTLGWGEAEEPVPPPGPKVILVANKCDLQGFRAPQQPAVCVSAALGEGLERLLASIPGQLGLLPLAELEGPTPFLPRHVDCLSRAVSSAAPDPRVMAHALVELAEGAENTASGGSSRRFSTR
ncbi:MAG: GTP-binding protein [Planctomycetota bacterium]